MLDRRAEANIISELSGEMAMSNWTGVSINGNRVLRVQAGRSSSSSAPIM